MKRKFFEIIRELRESGGESNLSIREIANRFIEQHGDDFERKVTPHWVGHIVRRKLQLKTERRREGYVLAASEGPKLARLFEKYGIESPPVNSVNFVNSETDTEATSAPQDPLFP